MAIKIRRQRTSYNIGSVEHLEYIENLHWSTISGGTYTKDPYPVVYGYVYCVAVDGEIDHSCEHGEGPHRIKVCIIKKDNTAEDWKRILEIVGPKPEKI